MPGALPFFGDGATLGLGGGPIRSQDYNSAGFSTGTVNFGWSPASQTIALIVVVILIGVILWQNQSNS